MAEHTSNSAAIRAAHRAAMAAKQEIFRAQDALGRFEVYAPLVLVRRIDKRLRHIRSELEALDRDVRNGVTIAAPLGYAERQDE